ncbi:MAG TPA: hypothetical protein VMF29_05545, partial [Candidatus Edwardsbacteria bacterium]|nr:hypothetical protein [Candidatus Edwardsbacteria bacterium]
MNVRLAKIFAGIGDGVLMLAALLAWWVIVMLLAGFVEIITGWNLILTTAGGVIIALVLPIGLTIAGYILLWKRARSLPLRSVMVAGGPAGAFKLFARAIGVLFAAYLIMWGVSAVVFGALVARQQKVLETMGLPRDWKAAMPAYQQHGNAGPLLWRVADSIKSRLPADGKSLPQLYSMLPALSDNPDTLKYLAPLIDRLETLNGPWLAKADSALACTLLVWKDYRAMSIDSVIAMRIPNYMGVQTLHRLYVLYAVKRAAAGDWSGCRRYFDKSNKLQSLLAQDPTLIGKMISLVNTGTTCEGLAVIEKIQRNRPESYALVTDVMKRMPPVDGSVRQGLVSEYSVFYGSWKSDKHSLMDVLSYTNGQMPQGRIVQLVWNTFRFTLYRLWEPWDRFCY